MAGSQTGHEGHFGTDGSFGGRPVHRMFSNVPGLPLLDASSSHPSSCDNQKTSPNVPRYPLGRATALG